MSGLRFEWDDRKAAENRRKHGVSFDEARTVFFDENALLIPDRGHSEDEDRFVLLGISSQLRILLVVHVYLRAEQEIRIISARKANPEERLQYEQRRLR